MAAARCTPDVVWRSQSAPARSVLTLSWTMPVISTPSCRSFNAEITLLARKRARIAPSTMANRLAIEILLRNMEAPEDGKVKKEKRQTYIGSRSRKLREDPHVRR